MMNEGTRSGAPHFTLNALRIVAGFMFWSHGMQKIFAVFGNDQAPEALTLLWTAGMIELVGGALICIGLLTRPAAFVCAGEMAAAYFLAHVPRGSFWPWNNGGELAALYCFVFLFIAAAGGGAFSVDGLIASRRSSTAAG